MDEHTLRDLEYYKILNILKGFAVSTMGSELALKLRPLTSIHAISELLSETIELQEILRVEGSLPVSSIKDIRAPLNRLMKAGHMLYPKDFLMIKKNLETVEELKEFFKEEEAYPVLYKKVERLVPIPHLRKRIEDTFDKDGFIRDDASSELLSLRRSIQKLKEEIRSLLGRILDRSQLRRAFSDRVITVRGGRYVLPVKRDYQALLPGIVHDESHSGSTYYIEPMESLSLNNSLTLMSKKVNEEEIRILTNLTKETAKYRDILEVMTSELAQWDLLYAKARLGLLLGSSKPKVNREGRINLKMARHPLLAAANREGVVPVDISFKGERNILVISGANAGGKTVSLKTLGLLTLMLQSGLTIPVDVSSEACIFKKILADIGDDQSIEDKMSTFSAHIRRLATILERADGRTLVLIDEIGTGTDPEEGSALALSILEGLKERSAKVMVTTHYPLLKVFAHREPFAENLSVEFDQETLSPTYRLMPGVPGISNALSIASTYGIERDIIERAKRYIERGDKGLSDIIQSLHKERDLVFEERRRIEELRLSLECLKKSRESLLQRLKDKRASLLEGVKISALKVEKQFKERARIILNDLEKEKIKGMGEFERRIGEVYKQLFTKRPVRRGLPYRPQRGEMVYLPLLKEKGRVTRLSTKEAEVQAGMVKVRVAFEEIAPLNDSADARGIASKKGKERVRINIDTKAEGGDIATELNIRGLRVDDALGRLDRFIDRAILKRMDNVYIIHGIGEGKLKRAVHDFLSSHPYVKTFKTGEVNKGVTTVMFEDEKERIV